MSLHDQIRKQVMRLELSTGMTARVAYVNPRDRDGLDDFVDGVEVLEKAEVPPGNVWVNA